MTKIYGGIMVASAMILLGLAKANDLVGEVAFDIGIYGLLASSAVMIGSGRCRLRVAR